MDDTNLVTTIYAVEQGFPPEAGGISSWIRDFLARAEGSYRLLGVRRSVKGRFSDRPLDSVLSASFLPIATLPKQGLLIPISLRMAVGIVLNRRNISQRVLLHQVELVPIVRLVKPKARITLVVHTNYLAHSQRGSDSVWRFAPAIFTIVERLGLGLADVVISHSPRDFPRLKTMRQDAIRVSGWYDDRVFFPRKSIRRANSVLWVGRFEAVKDPFLAVECMAALGKSTNVTMLMVGSGSMRDQIVELIRARGLEDRITLSGPFVASDLAAEMSRASVFLHTSHFEGSPRVILESLASGTPVVAFASCDTEGVIQNSCQGEIVDSRDAESLAHAVRRALSSRRKTNLLVPPGHSATELAPVIEKLIG